MEHTWITLLEARILKPGLRSQMCGQISTIFETRTYSKRHSHVTDALQTVNVSAA